jgi:hypothetical protein
MKLAISLLFNNTSEPMEWLEYVVSNYKHFISIPFDIYVNTNTPIDSSKILDIKLSPPIVKNWGNSELLRGHLENIKMAANEQYDYVIFLASNSLCINYLDENVFEKIEKQKIVGEPIPVKDFRNRKDWAWPEISADEYFNTFLEENNLNICINGQIEGLTVPMKHIIDFKNAFLKNISKYKIQKYAYEELFPLTFLEAKNLDYFHICDFLIRPVNAKDVKNCKNMFIKRIPRNIEIADSLINQNKKT